MHNKMQSTSSAVAVGAAGMLVGALFLLASRRWANACAGEAGAGIWAFGSVGMGMLMGVHRRAPAWICEYLHLLIYAIPAVWFGWLYSASADFPPLCVMNASLLLVAPVAGFWLGFYFGRSAGAASAAIEAGSGGKWMVVLLLQISVVGVPILLALLNAANRYLFWFEIYAVLWFPIGTVVCAVAPWARMFGLRRPGNWAVWPVCAVGWLFLVGFVVMLAVKN